ncbi:MAG: HXXEE domain-containing protein [Spirochaetes bacterium]|nr:HXXEE domain-containing protein [Spirochaetota bacterium]
MNIKIIYLIILIISIAHVFEEYFTGWLDYARQFKSDIKKSEFVVINILFLILVIISTLLIFFDNFSVFNLSVIFLIFLNSLIHIMPAVILRKYTPGFISALIGYFPLSIWVIFWHFIREEVSVVGLILSFLTGLLLMSIPFIFQGVIKKIFMKDKDSK